MTHSESIDELLTALAKAQGAFVPAVKDDSADINSAKGNYSYTFATIASVMACCRGPLSANGLAIVQPPETVAAGVVAITTLLGHSSGQWMSSMLELAYDPRSMQSLGSAITYGRRYALQAMVGLVTDDDDGASAVAPPAAASNGRGDGHHKPVVEPIPSNGRQEGRPPGREPGRAGNGRSDRLPRTGGQLYGWLADQGREHETDIVRYIDRWAKLQGFDRMMKTWSGDQVEAAIAEAGRKLASIPAPAGRGDAFEGAA